MPKNLKAVAPVLIEGLPAFRDNRIWLIGVGRRALIVDPGDAAVVFAALADRGLEALAVLLTHHHDDHVGGVEALAGRFPGLAVFGPAAESITGLTRPLQGGERLDLPGGDWSVLAVPGHTRGHLAYVLREAGGSGATHIFSGDLLFGLGCGRLFEGTPGQMLRALADIATFADDSRVYCAHEYTALNLPFARAVMPGNRALAERAAVIARLTAAGASTLPLKLGEEKATNPFLRVDDAEVIAAVTAHARAAGLAAPDDAVAVFAALRQWRNDFR